MSSRLFKLTLKLKSFISIRKNPSGQLQTVPLYDTAQNMRNDVSHQYINFIDKFVDAIEGFRFYLYSKYL